MPLEPQDIDHVAEILYQRREMSADEIRECVVTRRVLIAQQQEAVITWRWWYDVPLREVQAFLIKMHALGKLECKHPDSYAVEGTRVTECVRRTIYAHSKKYAKTRERNAIAAMFLWRDGARVPLIVERR